MHIGGYPTIAMTITVITNIAVILIIYYHIHMFIIMGIIMGITIVINHKIIFIGVVMVIDVIDMLKPLQ